MKFGESLKQERKKMQVTQEEVAKVLNVSRQTISSWENERSFPDLRSLVALSDFYHVSLDILLREDDEIMQHYDEQEQILGKGRQITLVSYWLNVVFIGLMIVNEVFDFSFVDHLTDVLGPLLTVNIFVNLIMRYVMKGNKLPKYFALKVIGAVLLTTILLFVFNGLFYPTVSYYNIGRIFGMFLRVISIFLIFFYPRKSLPQTV